MFLDYLFKELGLQQGPNNGDADPPDPEEESDDAFFDPGQKTKESNGPVKKKTDDEARKESHDKIDKMSTTLEALKEANDSNGSWGAVRWCH